MAFSNPFVLPENLLQLSLYPHKASDTAKTINPHLKLVKKKKKNHGLRKPQYQEHFITNLASFTWRLGYLYIERKRVPYSHYSATHRQGSMKISCNGCRILRKGCTEDCVIRPCLEWINSSEAQANATLFLSKFYGRAGLLNLINAAPLHHRTGDFPSPLYHYL